MRKGLSYIILSAVVCLVAGCGKEVHDVIPADETDSGPGPGPGPVADHYELAPGTLDATEGAEQEWPDWYPGDDYVDIIGVDIYEDNTPMQIHAIA